MSSQPGVSSPISLLVERVSVDSSKLTDEEKNLLSNEKLFFDDVDSYTSIYTPEEITEIFKKALSTKKVDHRRSLDDQRARLIASSIFRHDKANTPPLCMFCLNNDPVSTKMCGPLFWVPQFPKYFAFHYFCALMVPEISEAETPTCFEKCFRKLSVKGILKAAARMRKKKSGKCTKCSVCLMKGALCGCNKPDCKNAYHLPCAFAEGCLISCTEEEAPVKYGILCKEETKLAMDQQRFLQSIIISRFGEQEKRQRFLEFIQGNRTVTCLFCEKEWRIEKGQLFLNKIVFTICCGGVEASCTKCFQNFICSTQFIQWCPFRRCEINVQIWNFLGIQGIMIDILKLSGHRNPPQFRVACYYSGESMAPDAACLRHDQIGGAYNYEAKIRARFSPWDKLECQGMCGRACHLKCAPLLGEYWLGQIRFPGAAKWFCENCGTHGTPRSSPSPSPPLKRVKLEPHRNNLPASPETIDLDHSSPSTPSHRSPSYSGSTDIDLFAGNMKHEPLELSELLEPNDVGGEFNPICLDDDDEEMDGGEKGKNYPSNTSTIPENFINCDSAEEYTMNPVSLFEQKPLEQIPVNNETEAILLNRATFPAIHTSSEFAGPLSPLVFPEEKPSVESTQAPLIPPHPVDLRDSQPNPENTPPIAAPPATLPVSVQGPSSVSPEAKPSISLETKNLTENSNSVEETSRPNCTNLDVSQVLDRLVKLECAVFKGDIDQPTQNIQNDSPENKDRKNNLDQLEAMADNLVEMYKSVCANWNALQSDDRIRLRKIKEKLMV